MNSVSRSPPTPSLISRSASLAGIREMTRFLMARTSGRNPGRCAASHTSGDTMSQKACPSSRSPAAGRAFRRAWNSQFFAHLP